MRPDQIIMYIMALGALIGGVDFMLGNRFGFGCRFQQAFQLLGSIALSMAGIICLAPLLSRGVELLFSPLCTAIGMDPGIFGGLLAIDMGGYPLAEALSLDPRIVPFSGIILASTFGCTIVFTIPVGLGTIGPDDRQDFTRGILLGLISLPAAIFAGGLLCGLSLTGVLWNAFPILVLCVILFWGIAKHPDRMSRLFQIFAELIRILAALGLTLAAVSHMTGIRLLNMPPLMEAMETVCSIGIVMLGGMPMAEILQRLLRKPFLWIGRRTGMNPAATTGILLGMVSVTPALAIIPDMDRRGKIVCSAFLVCGASALAAHLGFALTVLPEALPAMLAAKLLGGTVGIAAALLATRNMSPAN